MKRQFLREYLTYTSHMDAINPVSNGSRHMMQKLSIGLMVILFLFSSIDKILHYEGFLNALRDYSLVPQGFAMYLAIPVIVTEAMISLGLTMKQWRSVSSFTAACTLGVFSVALLVNHIYGKRGVCGCWFTITLAQGTGLHILQNLLLIALSISIWWNEKTNKDYLLAAPSVRHS